MAKPNALTGHTLFLNRCIGGCAVTVGPSNATVTPTPVQFIPNPANIAQATDLTDEEWAGIVQCVKEVYSPFDMKIVDTRPLPGTVTNYSAIIVGGTDEMPANTALGLPPDVGGVGGGGCTPAPTGVSFAFADNDNVNAFALEVSGVINTESRILGMCWIIAQETAHNFGLPNHQFTWQDDGSSACNDPMTYRFECGGQKFFRNRFANCGEFPQQGQQPCQCGSNQNSHLKLLNLFGEGTSLIPAPTSALITPAANSTAANSLGNVVNVEAGSKRGVAKVELYINGFKWAEAPGAPFGREGQRNPAVYAIPVPEDLPNSIVDVQVKAFDDLGIVGESPIVTVVKGPAGGCANADACAEGQKCEAGKCFWDPPSGEIGDSCTYPQFCLSGLCSDSVIADDGICTQPCVVGIADACPMGLECVATQGSNGVCYKLEETGCCSTSRGRTPWAPFALGAIVFGLLVVRRRR